MPVTRQNLFFSRGDTFTFSCLAQDYQQNIIDLTGATIACTVKRTAGGASLFTGTPSATIAAAGTFTVTFAPAATSDLPSYSQVLPYDVQVTKSGNVTSVQSGQIYLSPETLP